jgi:hypothetical protein
MVWTNSWSSIASAGCGLNCVGAGEERARKVYALRGLPGVERQVGLTRGTRWPAGSSANRMVAIKARRSRGQEPVQGSGSRSESARGVCGGSPQNRRVTWLSQKTPENQDRRLGGQRRDPSVPRSFEAEDTRRDRQACVEDKRGAVAGQCYDEYSQSAPRGVYPSIM